MKSKSGFKFSSAPLTRGSTHGQDKGGLLPRVCPAHAGIYLDSETCSVTHSCLPRSRGDLPLPEAQRIGVLQSAPLTRGSTLSFARNAIEGSVCPAHAGIYPTVTSINTGLIRLPRSRGDLPRYAYDAPIGSGSAPLTRGSTLDAPCA